MAQNDYTLYKIQTCTICLAQLSENLTSLSCGHVFHLHCITQHFEYRNQCPNCKKRCLSKEIRPVFFGLTKNTEAASLMRQILGDLSLQDKQQMQTLFKQYQASIQNNEKLEKRLAQSQKQSKKSVFELNQAKVTLNKSKIQLQTLRRDSLELKKVIQHLHKEIKSLSNQNLEIRVTVEKYKQKQSEYEKIKIIKRKIADNSAQLIRFKAQLQKQRTPADEMARQFFDMLMMKGLQMKKLKDGISQQPARIQQKVDQIQKLRSQLDRQKRESKQIQQKRALQKKKFEQLKVKYKTLIQKFKAKCLQLSEQQNYEDSLLSRPSFPMNNGIQGGNKQTNFNNSLNESRILNNSMREENIPLNIEQNKIQKKNRSDFYDSMMIEDEGSNNVSKLQKKPSQATLNGFVSQKPSFGASFNSSFGGSFGGVMPKKKIEEKKVGLKNIFGL